MWGLFERYGIELEYMICDRNSLNILPIADKLIFELSGAYPNEVEAGAISYSNELALHVIELKTTQPVRSLDGVDSLFVEHVNRLNKKLVPFNACLVPTGMHPWMDPFAELRLWPHGQNPIYEAYNRIFDCRGHGWANLQSVHLNLSFATDEELRVLHSAIRWLLPIMPALSASSPVADNKLTGFCDTRLEMYRKNQLKIPSIIGSVIPEPIASKEEYFEKILQPMWRDVSPYDPEKILREEWLNSRGAIVRFDRNAIEIRVLDTQESPFMDCVIVKGIVSGLMHLVERIRKGEVRYDAVSTEDLSSIFLQTIREADSTPIVLEEYLALFGEDKPLLAKDLWKKIFRNSPVREEGLALVQRGPLSKTIAKQWEQSATQEGKKHIYQDLADCLSQGMRYEAT